MLGLIENSAMEPPDLHDKSETRSSSSPFERPQTPHDFSLLKSLSLRQGDVSSLSSSSPAPAPAPTLLDDQTPETTAASVLQTTGQNLHAHALNNTSNTTFPESVKRDSAFAHCDSSARQSSPPTSEEESAKYKPTLPAIPIQDEPQPESRKRSKSPFVRRRNKNSPDLDLQNLGAHQRIKSFHGISLDIPSGDLAGLTKAPDQLEFSQRGSILLSGETMDDIMANQAEQDGGLGIKQDEQPNQDSLKITLPETPPRSPGLKSGKRTPSIQMLRAAIEGRRVLSAEEVSFSLRVRSMYEAGDGNATDWSKPAAEAKQINTMPETDEDIARIREDSPKPQNGSLSVNKTRVNGHVRPATAPAHRLSYISRATERAGGLEDWEDVDAKDLDRFGFIDPERIASNASRNDGNTTPSRPRIQRVSTSLQLIADSPRRKRSVRRAPSTATRRTSRSFTPSRSKDARSLRTQSSLYSFRSTSSSLIDYPFRSRESKLMDAASDMLTLPPGLEAIAEQEDAGRTAMTLKRRELLREAKWRQMGRLVDRGPKGGGMSFEVDTRHPKLASRTWKGIPESLRTEAWHAFLSASARRRGPHPSDEDLSRLFYRLQDESSPDDVQIDVDVPRTISMHIMFRRRYRGGQRSLFRVLHAISLHFPDVGYVQGMASLAATLLCYYQEELAFVMMVRLWQLRGLEVLFRSGFDGLMSALSEFESQWLGNGAVGQKLEQLGITSTAYGTRWYLTLFNMSMPFQAQLRVWDVFMLLGDQMGPVAKGAETFGGADLDVLHATSAALVDATRDIVLDSDFENAMKVLTSWVPVKDEDLLMKVAKAEYKAKKKRGKA